MDNVAESTGAAGSQRGLIGESPILHLQGACGAIYCVHLPYGMQILSRHFVEVREGQGRASLSDTDYGQPRRVVAGLKFKFNITPTSHKPLLIAREPLKA